MSLLGKVWKRACGPHTSVSSNVRMRGRACPEAWVSPVPERVSPKVEANRHKSQLSRSVEAGWKRGRNARTPTLFKPGSFQEAGTVMVFLPEGVRSTVDDVS